MGRAGWVALLWLGHGLMPVVGQGPPVPGTFDGLRTFEGVSTQRIVFHHLTIEDGLSQNAVYALLQDRQGFMWMGTKDGLNRYDGSAVTVYRHDPFDPATLSSSYVTALLEDTRGGFWVGTQDGGLSRLDRATGAVVRYARSPRLRITALVEDARGDIWLGTAGGGAYRLAASVAGMPEAAFHRYAHDPRDATSLSDDRVTSLLADHRGTLWIGTGSGLNRLDRARGGFLRIGPRPGDPASLIDDFVTAISEARDRTIWVGTPSGLSRLVGPRAGAAGVRFVSYPYTLERRGYGWGTIHRIGEGPMGRLWLAMSDGLARFDPATGTYASYLHDPLDAQSLSGNSLATLAWDRTGVLWVGANGYGVNRYDAKTARFESIRRPPDPTSRQDGFSVRAILQDEAGVLWISAGVLYRYDSAARTLVSFEAPSTEPSAFGNTGVWSIAQDRRGHLWFGSYEGLYRYDASARRVRQYAHDPTRRSGLPEKVVYGVFEDRRGAIWAVTAHFISRLDDAEDGTFTSYRHSPATDVGEGLYPAIHEDARGQFWMGTEQGLVRFDPRTGALRRYRTNPADAASLSHDQVRAVTPDPREPESVLWIGTAGGGLNRLDMRTGAFTRVTVRDGLPNNVVYGVRADRHGRLWLSTNRGLARYDPRTREIRTYDVYDGLQSNEFNSGASFRAADGRLYFGGINGVTAFHPDSLGDNAQVPPVVITGFRRAGRQESPHSPDAVLTRAMSATDTLRLSFADNVFTFEFAALDYSAPERNRYSYRMEGFDADWTVPSAERTATYTNLPPGRYTFRVRASNNDGLWNTEGASVAVIIAAPWWRTAWAYGVYLLLALGAVAALAWYRRNRLLLKHRLAIEHLEAEKLRELDRSRSQFFANVSHEFRTPLTLTLGPLDDLKAGLHGTLTDAMVEQVDLARRNAGRVLDLINQILDVARLEARRMPLHARPLDIGSFSEACLRRFQPLAERNGLTLSYVPPPRPLTAWADPDHLEKVLVNLISNAVKFTPPGGTVRVNVAPEAAAVRVDVRDSGPGIPPSDLPHIFDRFYRVDEASTRRQPGTGIGLALAKELVDLLGGSLSVSSEEGFGSTFTMTLPLGRAHLAPGQVADQIVVEDWIATAPVQTEEPGGDGMPEAPAFGDGSADEDLTTVLVVDDHPDVRAYIRRHLQSNYRVVEAADGVDGLAKARRLLPDLIVSDVMMPDLDGFGLCSALKNDPETSFIPIILLTAKAATEDRLEGLREHCDDYLTKPFDPEELRVRIGNLIDQRRRLRERFEGEATAGRPPAAELHAARVAPHSADDVLVERVRDFVEANMADDAFSVERLAAGVGMSRAHLHRRLSELLGRSPSELVRGMRLERAAELLRARAGSVSEVAYAVGFKSVAHFSNAFRDRYGCRPSAYAAALDVSERGA